MRGSQVVICAWLSPFAVAKMFMFSPSLPLLHETVHPSIEHVTAELIKHSSTPAAVYRLYLTYGDAVEGIGPLTLIAKRTAPDWPNDAWGHLRETLFYVEVAPKLRFQLPKIYYAGSDNGTPCNLILMEDVRETHRFPEPTHLWTMDEIKLIVHAYAKFHSESAALVPPAAKREWLLPRHETRLYETAADLPHMVDELVSRSIWPPIPAFENLVATVLEAAVQFEQAPTSLLHNDVYPPNAALPVAGGDEVLLFDWEMISWGLPEMDLAFMFMQPFRSSHNLDRDTALAWYWQMRSQQESRDILPVPSLQERRARQRYADSLWALWLIPVAHQMVQKPFPERSFPRQYWDSMLGVLAGRLAALAGENG